MTSEQKGRDMRVLFLTNVYPNGYGKSEGAFVHEQAKALRETGCQVDVLYVDLRSIRKKRRWGRSEEEREGIRVIHWSLPCGPIPVLLDLLYLALQKRALRDYVKGCGVPEVVHGHFYVNGFFCRWLKRKFGVRCLVTEHSSELFSDRIGFLHRRMMKRAYEGADCVIAVSEALKGRMERYTTRKVHVVGNVISGNFHYAERPRNKGFRFLSVGRVTESKGMRTLIEAFEELQSDLEDVSLTIVGDGALRRELEAHAGKRGLRVLFLGEVGHERLPEIYRQSDCFVLPSLMETFGVVYVEAMACGLPVIATRCGGPEEFVDDSNGILVSVGSRAELCEAMRKVREGSSGYCREGISENVHRKYGGATVGRALMELYRRSR